MSIGRGGSAKRILEDGETVVYEYYSFEQNEPGFDIDDIREKGTISIGKDCFVDPEIHEKTKKLPSGRKKLIVKRIPRQVDTDEMLREGHITIENCDPCFRKSTGEWQIDVMALTLLRKILQEYQENEIIPENVDVYM